MIKPITPGQKRQITGFAGLATEAVLEELGLTSEQAQRVVRAGAECQERMREQFRSIVMELATPEEYASEEVPSNYGYLSGYRQPRTLLEQANRLKELFPELRGALYDDRFASEPRPKGAEGHFILLDWRQLGETYADAYKKVFGKVREVYGGNAVNYLEREGKLTEKHLRESAAKRSAMERIREAQKGHDFLVVAGQFGHLHRGRSVRRARAVMQDSGQFGFGLFESLILLLTHPDRLRHYDDLWIDCAGDEISWNGDGQVTDAPYVGFHGGMLKVLANGVGSPYDYYGSVSGFSPQS